MPESPVNPSEPFKFYSAGRKLIFFTLFFFAASLLMDLLGDALSRLFLGTTLNDIPLEKLGNPEVLRFQRLLILIGQLVVFLLPALVFSQRYGGHSMSFFPVKYPGKRVFAFYLLLLMPCIIPLSNALAEWVAMMPFPEALEESGRQFREMSERLEELTLLLIQADNLWALMGTIVLFAAIPALCEEFFFRGVMQRLLAQSTRNVHWGIWASAFFFSFIHLDFDGFFSRLLLGALFGYLLIWSGSIWMPVLGHFLNNGLSLVLNYWAQKSGKEDLMDASVLDYPLLLLSCTVLTGILLYLYYKKNVWKEVKEDYLGL